MTLVDLITAVTTDPTSRFKSSTASVDNRETSRYGPHWRSTCDITASLLIAVTRPSRWFRALEWWTLPGWSASSLAQAASSAPLTTARPASSLSALSLPESTHRRTVSSETPMRLAARLIRYCVTFPLPAPLLRDYAQILYAFATRHVHSSAVA